MPQVISILGNVEDQASPMRGGVPNQQASGADAGAQIGQALQGFGNALGGLAATVAQEQARRQSFTEEASFIDFQAQQQAAFTEAARGASGSNAMGFTATRMKDLDAAFAEWSKANPSASPERRNAQYREFRARMGQQALSTELQTTDSFYATQIKDKLDLWSKGIAQSPADAATYIQQGEAFIDASGLPDGVKQQLKQGWREAGAAAKAQGLLTTDPGALQGALSGASTPEAFVDRLMGSESGGRFDAQNNVEGSGGTGHYGRIQFSRARLEEAKAAGAIPADMTPEEFLNNPQAQRAAELWHVKDIDTYIESKGYAQRGYSLDGLRAVAHLGGKAGLDKFVATGGQYDPADANGTKLSDYYKRFATGAASDPVLANLSYADTLRFSDQAQNAVVARDQQSALAAKAEYDGKLNTLLTSLNDGTAGVGAIEAARAEGWLTDYDDIKKAQGILGAANEKSANLSAGIAALNDSNTVWNPFDKDQKKQMDAVVAAQPDPVTTGYNVWAKTGILPDASTAALRNGLISTDPTKVLGAARIAGNMIASNPNAFASVGEGRGALEEAGIEFNRQVNQLGRTPEEAAQVLAQMNDPLAKANAPKREDVQAFEQTLRKDGVTGSVLGTFDPGMFSAQPEGGLTAAQQAVMDGDYIAFATENFRQYGDEGRAKEYAAAQMKKLYGVSNGRVTKYPPEKVYPPINGSHDYLYQQAAEAIKSATGRDVKPENVYLVPRLRGATAEAWRQGKLPPYGLTYLYEDPETGQMQFDTIPGKVFVADPKAPMAAAATQREIDFAEARYAEWERLVAQRKMLEQEAVGLRGTATLDLPPLPAEPPKPPSVIRREQQNAYEAPPMDPGTFTDPMTGFAP